MTHHYIFEEAESLLCVPACLNMVFRRRGLDTYPNKDLAYHLGLRVPKELQKEFPNAIISDNKNDWGVHPQKNKYSITSLFKKLDISIVFRYISVRNIPSSEVVDFINENLARNNDIIIGYDYKTVFGSGEHVGHVSLISEINMMDQGVLIIDPEVRKPVQLLLSYLIKGISVKNDGFWLIADNAESMYLTPY